MKLVSIMPSVSRVAVSTAKISIIFHIYDSFLEFLTLFYDISMIDNEKEHHC